MVFRPTQPGIAMSIEISEIVIYHSPGLSGEEHDGTVVDTLRPSCNSRTSTIPPSTLGPQRRRCRAKVDLNCVSLATPKWIKRLDTGKLKTQNQILRHIYIYLFIYLFSASSMTNPDVYRLNIRFCWLNRHLAFRNPYAYLSIQSKQTTDLSICLPPYPTLPYPTLTYPTLLYLSVCSI